MHACKYVIVCEKLKMVSMKTPKRVGGQEGSEPSIRLSKVGRDGVMAPLVMRCRSSFRSSCVSVEPSK